VSGVRRRIGHSADSFWAGVEFSSCGPLRSPARPPEQHPIQARGSNLDRAHGLQNSACEENVMLVIKNVLVATDFSECSDAALTYGRALAGQFDARLHVLHVIEFLGAVDVAGMGVYSAGAPELMDQLEAEAHDRLNRLLSASGGDPLKAQTVLNTSGTPAHAIVDYAKSADIDLVIVGTHGRRGLSHLLLGSVAERVVREAPCPVLTVRHPQRDFVVAGSAAEASCARV
jgi:nucleotide-binding universal stress UspA family protein